MINVELWQKDIAQAVGLKEPAVSKIINKNFPKESEPTIKTSSAAEEIAPQGKESPDAGGSFTLRRPETLLSRFGQKGRYASSIRSEKYSW